jgi:polysaccharide export outer membrane protein
MKTYYRIVLSIFFIACSQNVLAQVSADFLSNLPDLADIATYTEDTEKESSFNPNPDTSINKLFYGIDEIKNEIDKLEAEALREYFPDKFSDEIHRFGINFFDSYQTTYAPISDSSTDLSYILGEGDVLKIQIVGLQSKTHILNVERDGSLNIPRVGVINVFGLSLDQASKLIIENIENILVGYDAFVSLSALRDMNILVIGQVDRPGIYTVSGGSNILGVLNSIGGVNDKGSFRSIEHKRDNVLLQEIDLYDFMINGNTNTKFALRNGDTLIINPVGRQVSISGGINNPAIYELKSNENLLKLIEFAGGTSQGSTEDAADLIRADGEIFNLSTLNSDFILKNGDNVQIQEELIYSIPAKTIEITGAVKKPGKYTISDGDTISKVIRKAGGYKDNAYPKGGSLFREKAKEIEQVIIDKSYNDLITYLATSGSARTSVASRSISTILDELKMFEPKGRVSAEFTLSNLDRNPSIDIPVMSEDVIEIPYFTGEVFVLGEVLNQGGRTYDSSMSARDYINKSGSFSRFADKDRLVVILPNGEAYSPSNSFFGSQDIILPGSIIYVPRDIGRIEGINFAATLAPIFSSLALSLASLNSINN